MREHSPFGNVELHPNAASRNPSFIDMLDGDCLVLIFKAVKSYPLDTTISTPHQVHDRNQELFKLRQVRRDWKSLIDSQSYLWNSIAFILGDHTSMESACLFLRYSRTALIHLYGYGASSTLDRHTRKLAQRLKRQLQAASGRIASFHISKPESYILRLWPIHAPNLKELVIETTCAFPAVFQGDMPLLHSIVIPVKNSRQYLMARNLTSLTLYPPYTLAELLATLNNTPMLQRLELQRIFEFYHGDPPQVRLPHLEDLSLVNSWHDIINFLDFPKHTRITIAVPEHLRTGLSWQDMDTISSFFIPPSFLRSPTLVIATSEVPGPTEVRIVGQNRAKMDTCHVYIDFNKESGGQHRYCACIYAMGMVRNSTSVSAIRFDLQAKFHAKCTSWFKRFTNLRELTLTGPHTYPVLLDLISAELNAVPSLQRLVLDQTFTPIYRKFKDWIVAREQAGYKIVDCLIPIEID